MREILIQIFLICSTSFYDDFDVVEVEALAANARDTVQEVFGTLGWALKPLPEFAACSEPLGAILDLSRCRDGVAVLRNRPGRVSDIIVSIDELSCPGAVDADILPRLRGRLVFAQSLTFGRFGGNAMRALSAACALQQKHVIVDGALARALFDLKRFLTNSKPREIRVSHLQPPALYSDGFFEPASFGPARGGIGAAFLDPADGSYGVLRPGAPDWDSGHVLRGRRKDYHL